MRTAAVRTGAAERIKRQFAVRSPEFDISAKWVADKELVRAHTDLAGAPSGRALDLCCGTGQIGRALKGKGWDVHGLDICRDMLRISSRYFPVTEGSAEEMPFQPGFFRLVACRQTLQFLDIKKVLSGTAKILAPRGTFIVSLTVPFSQEDKDWLYEIHRAKQPLLLRFYTAADLVKQLQEEGFLVRESRTLRVRESVDRWMSCAPELSAPARKKVISMVKDAPPAYKRLHRVRVAGKKVFEDWNWVILKTEIK